MSISPAASQPLPAAPSPLPTTPVIVKKNDRDGDEVKGVDPKNEAAKAAASQNAAAPANSNLGKIVNTTA